MPRGRRKKVVVKEESSVVDKGTEGGLATVAIERATEEFKPVNDGRYSCGCKWIRINETRHKEKCLKHKVA